VARREEKGRDYPRWKARLYAAVATLHKYPHIAVTLDSEHHQEAIRTHVLMISNNPYDLSRLGIESPRLALEEGRLSVYWLPHMPRLKLTSFVAHYLAGRVHRAPGFRSFRTSRVKVDSSKRHLHLGVDGEVVTMNTPLVITIVPQSLSVKVPR
jgi:diacylglycerol kinase family enzyme